MVCLTALSVMGAVCPVHFGADFLAMAANQPGDQEIVALKTTGTGLKLENAVEQEVGPMHLCDVSTGRARPIVLVTGISEPGWV